jgi:WD40 repeat protein
MDSRAPVLPTLSFASWFWVIACCSGSPVVAHSVVAHKVQTITVDREVGALDFSPDGQFLAIDSPGGTSIWSLQRGQIIEHIAIGIPGSITAKPIHFSPDSRYLAVCGYAGNGRSDYAVFIYETKHWTLAHKIVSEKFSGRDTGQGCSGAMFSADSRYLLRVNDFPNNEFTVLLYDISSWKVVSALRRQLFETEPADGMSIAGQASLSKSGQYLALAGNAAFGPPAEERSHLDPFQVLQRTRYKSAVWLVDMPSGKLVRSIIAPGYSLSWRPDGRRLAVGGDATVQLIDPISGATVVTQDSQLRPTEFGSAQGTAYGRELVAFSPDGHFLVEAMDRQVEVWDADHANRSQTIRAVPECIAVSPDSRLVALGGAEVSLLEDVSPVLDLFVHPQGAGGKVLLYEIK